LQRPEGLTKEEFFATCCPPLPANHEPTENEPDGVRQLLETRQFRAYVRNHWTEEQWRMHRWAYHRLTEMVDKQIGIVLSALNEAGLEDNTIVVLTSDHGDMDGAHRLEHKTVFYEEAIRIPLIIRCKGVTRPGLVDEAHLVSNGLDIFPTLCELADLAVPEQLPGRSLQPLLQGHTPQSWRKQLTLENQVGFMVTDGRFKYTLDDTGEHREMLIDRWNDPGEMTNLIGDPAYNQVTVSIRNKLSNELRSRGIAVRMPN